MSMERINQGVRYHDAVIHNGIIYCSGMTATDRGDDITLQCEGIFYKLDALLENCGSDKDHMLHVQVFVKNASDVAAFNEAWDHWINKETAPSRDLSVTMLGRAAILAEVVVTAAVIEE